MRARLFVAPTLVLLLAGCGDADNVFTSTTSGPPESTTATSEPATSTTAPPTTTTPAATTTTTLPPEPVWQLVPDDQGILSGPGEQAVWGVAMGGPGVVAVGFDYSGPDGAAAVWTSVEGTAWARAGAGEAALDGAGDQTMAGVVVGPTVLVAVGSERLGEEWDAAVWVSADGLAWSRIPPDVGVFGGAGDQRMWNAAAGGPGVVAVGLGASAEDVEGGDAAVWTSPDGLSWSRVPPDAAVFGGAGTQEMLGVAAFGSGLVAVGWDESGGDEDAAVWVSSDGLSWSRVRHDAAALGGDGDQQMSEVLPWGSGLVAVGWDESGGDQDAAVWVSSDGLSWSRVRHDEAVLGGDGDQRMLGLAVTGRGLVAVGDSRPERNLDAAVWTSVDGLTWQRVPHRAAVFGGRLNQTMYRVTALGDLIVAVGEFRPLEDEGDEWDGLIWVASPPG